ncbi:hypothetical protein Q3V23_19070 [Streptomyces sp. VNUA116]|uniref:zinc finger domain-containing protein n=1 Tax=Streptomyces sp. VNUA116 TaxID=3062449 RepID=UPI0026771105|nr:hypothetical protein [Streptomyces sp. VNUA116]WKU45992.1 hypothetical protein Q3V23_19070 [Streptomyces sp. VNUA116]
MEARHVAALLNFAATLDSRVRRIMATNEQAAATIRAWAQALADIPAVAEAAGWDASRAVRRYYEQRNGDRSAQFRAIEPADLLAAWAPHLAELMNRHSDPLPSADPDNPAAWRAELLGTRAAVATGNSAPSTHRQLSSAPHPALEARLATIGSPIPPEARQMLIPFRRMKAQREAAVAAGQADPLSVPCPVDWCRAEKGKPCRYRRMTPDGVATSNARRQKVHPSRVDAARAALEGVAA